MIPNQLKKFFQSMSWTNTPHHINPGKTVIRGEWQSRILDVPEPGCEFGRPLTDWKFFPNGVTYVGVNYLLNTGFRGTTQSPSWFAGLIADGTVTLSINDTSASHSGWTELTTYSSTPRLAWSPGAAALGSLTTTAITFTMNADSNVRGAFLASSSTKNSTTDILYCTAIESAPRAILNGQQYQLIYTVNLLVS